MNELKIFKSEQFGAVRTMVDNQTHEVLFNGKDVAKALGYKNTNDALSCCKGGRDLRCPSAGGPQLMKFIPESDLYRLVMSSKLPDAVRFQDWVCEEVLPQIRKTGGYIPVTKEDDEKTILSRALLICQRTIEQKDKLIDEQKPLVKFAKALSGSESSIHLSEMAKLLTENGHEIGRTRFYSWLRKHGYIFQHSTEPIQEWVSRGIFEVKATIVEHNHLFKETITPLVTAKGQQYFLDVFK